MRHDARGGTLLAPARPPKVNVTMPFATRAFGVHACAIQEVTSKVTVRMKKIEAVIKPFKLDEVKEALHEVGFRASPWSRPRASAGRRATPRSTAAPNTSSISCPR